MKNSILETKSYRNLGEKNRFLTFHFDLFWMRGEKDVPKGIGAEITKKKADLRKIL